MLPHKTCLIQNPDIPARILWRPDPVAKEARRSACRAFRHRCPPRIGKPYLNPKKTSANVTNSRTSLWMLGFIDFKKAGSAVSRIQVQSGRGCTGSAREAGGKCEMSWFQTMKRVSLLCAASPEGPGGSPKGPRRSPKGPRRAPGAPRRPGGFRRVPGNPGECRGSPDFLRGSTEGPRRIRGGSAEDARTFPGGPRRISVWRHFTL